MKTLWRVAIAIAPLLCTHAALGDSITRSVIANGGGTSQSASGNYTLSGTIAQPATDTMSGGVYTLTGGFWTAIVPVVPDAGPVDAGIPDAGQPDAGGPVDAGPDAGTDAGPISGSPTITSVTPSQGYSNQDTPIVLQGTDFEAGALVVMGSGSLTSIDVLSSSIIEATVPHGTTPGTYDVIVINPDGKSGTLSQAFTELAGSSSTTSTSTSASNTTSTSTSTSTSTGSTGLSTSTTSTTSTTGTNSGTTSGTTGTNSGTTANSTSSTSSTNGTNGTSGTSGTSGTNATSSNPTSNSGSTGSNSGNGKKGCGCDASPTSSVGMLWGLLALLARRRRQN